MRRLRDIPAILALLGLCLPWARVVAISGHLSAEHERMHVGEGATELEESFHGHRHDAGEQEHRHALINVDLVARRAKAIESVLAPALTQLNAMVPAHPADQVLRHPPDARDSGHGPPRTPSPRTILRI